MSEVKLIDLLKVQRRLDDITQMAKVIEITEQIARDAHCGYPSPRMMATDLYEKGYRKQEWISVDERFPKLYETVLVFCKLGVSQLQCVSEMIEPNGKRWSAVCGLPVTHWMPLPEAPKMKGGAHMRKEDEEK